MTAGALDRAWEEINSLRALDPTIGLFEHGHTAAVNKCLAIIESLGGKDPLRRKHELKGK